MADQSSADLNTRMRMSTHASDGNTLKTLLTFTLMMVTLPIMFYFLSKYIIEDILSMSSASLYAAVVAVIIVHIVLGLFVYVAWNEDAPSKPVKSD